jgi:hypothetical protein
MKASDKLEKLILDLQYTDEGLTALFEVIDSLGKNPQSNTLREIVKRLILKLTDISMRNIAEDALEYCF